MSIIGRSLSRNLRFPDDGDDNPKARRRGFGPFLSVPTPEDEPRWEARNVPADGPISDPGAEAAWREFIAIVPGPNSPAFVIPMDPPPPIVLPFEDAAWTDPDGEDESHAETIDIRAELRGLQYDLYSLDIG